MTKALYRKEFLKQRDNLEENYIKSASETFCSNFFRYFSDKNLQEKTIMVYSSFRNEAGTQPLIDGLRAAGARVVLPTVNGTDVSAYYYSGTESLKKGSFGIDEPDPDKCRPCEPQEIDMVIVPGLVFDEKGGRLGFGRGYYDRFLPKTRSDVLKIGLCYSFQLLSSGALPMENHDIFMDMILTENKLFNCKKHNCTDR